MPSAALRHRVLHMANNDKRLFEHDWQNWIVRKELKEKKREVLNNGIRADHCLQCYPIRMAHCSQLQDLKKEPGPIFSIAFPRHRRVCGSLDGFTAFRMWRDTWGCYVEGPQFLTQEPCRRPFICMALID